MSSERLSKVLCQNGIASRRKCDAIISSGRVKVNNKLVDTPYCRVDLSKDRILVDDVEVIRQPLLVYFALYKPIGYISDLSDPQGRRIARELIPSKLRIFPVGRLDYNSEGLIIFTNDGNLANTIMHPRHMIEKEYHVKLSGRLNVDELNMMVQGINISDQSYKVSSISEIRDISSTKNWYCMTLNEGKNRMIRKMAEALNYKVIRLKRVRIANIRLGNLKIGEFRTINSEELNSLISRNDI